MLSPEIRITNRILKLISYRRAEQKRKQAAMYCRKLNEESFTISTPSQAVLGHLFQGVIMLSIPCIN
jgi:hypothetical protein